jgi:hypothetical protein
MNNHVYLMLICYYMFRRNRHLQGAYVNVLRAYNNKIVLHKSYISNEYFNENLQYLKCIKKR